MSATVSSAPAATESDAPALSPELMKLIDSRRVQAWRKGHPGLEVQFVYLLAEIQFPKEKGESWTLSQNTMDVESLERAMRRELEPIEAFFASDQLIWNRLGIRPVLLRAEEVQPQPFRFADLIFLSMTVPYWVSPLDRNSFVLKATKILQKYRTDNLESIIIAVTKHPHFQLKKDARFQQWTDITQETTGIGKKGRILQLVTQQFTSPQTIRAYLNGTHTTQRLEDFVRIRNLQRHVNALQPQQVECRLLVILHPALYDTDAKRTEQRLEGWQFKKVAVIQQPELRPEMLREYDFFLLVHCGFPERFRDVREVQRITRRIYKVEGSLPSRLPGVSPRPLSVRNHLEQRFLRLQEEIREREESAGFQSLSACYTKYWKLLQVRNASGQQVQALDLRLSGYEESYFSLLEIVLLEATRHVHGDTQFAGIMRSLTRYLVVDDFSNSLVEFLVGHRFPRVKVHTMGSLELFQRFNEFKQQHPELNGPRAYQQFMRDDPKFQQYEVVVVNAWNVETDGTLNVKLRLAPVSEGEDEVITEPEDIILTSRNLHDVISTHPQELIQRILGDASGSEGGEERRGLDIVTQQIISHDDLTTVSRMMGVKKGKLYRVFQIGEELAKLHQELQELHNASVNSEDKAAGSWMAPLIEQRTSLVEAAALGCAIRWQEFQDNTKAFNFLKIEAERTEVTQVQALHNMQICVVSTKPNLPTKHLLAAFPAGAGLQQLNELPLPQDIPDLGFTLYVLDLDSGSLRLKKVIEFLRGRNRSPMAHVPVILISSPETHKRIAPQVEAQLSQLIGIQTPPEGDGTPMPYLLESLDNPGLVKHFIQGLLRLDPETEAPPS
ncbi:MAG TPA: hypothetical protein EYM25_07710 [Deltaproteobacteria bacterium]|nr:hypothetical protein [Deltaproteobacteria bacterium]